MDALVYRHLLPLTLSHGQTAITLVPTGMACVVGDIQTGVDVAVAPMSVKPTCIVSGASSLVTCRV